MDKLQLIIIVIIAAQFILFLLGFLFPKDDRGSFYKNIIYIIICCFLIIEIITAIPKRFNRTNPFGSILNSSAETETVDFKDYLDKYKEQIARFLE